MVEVRVNDLSPIIATAIWLALLALAVVLWIRLVGVFSLDRMASSLSPTAVVREFLGYENRWRILALQVAVAVLGLLAVLIWDPVNKPFLHRHSAFFQTAAQVQAGVLVAFALTQYGDDHAARGVRPSVILAVLFGAIALVAGVAGTTPLLPRDLHVWVLALTISGGIGSLLSLVLVSWRLLR